MCYIDGIVCGFFINSFPDICMIFGVSTESRNFLKGVDFQLDFCVIKKHFGKIHTSCQDLSADHSPVLISLNSDMHIVY